LKFYYGYEAVGWAAGGDVVNVRTMKKNGLKKSDRKIRIIRTWRIQTIFLFCNIMIPPLTFCLFQFGINQFIVTLDELLQVNDVIDSKAYVGLSIIHDMIEQNQFLSQLYETNQIYNGMMMIPSFSNDSELRCPISNFMSFNNETTAIAIDDIPQNQYDKNKDGIRSRVLLDFQLKQKLNESILNTPHEIINYIAMLQDSIMNKMKLEQASNAYNYNGSNENLLVNIIPFLEQITVVTHSIKNGIDSIYNHDWIVKLFAMILNICSVFMIIGVILAKSNIVWPAYRCWCIYILVPVFSLSLVALIYMTCIVAMIAMMNSDFCMGGSIASTSSNTSIPIQFSPINTIHDMLRLKGYTEQSVLHQSFEYYGTVRSSLVFELTACMVNITIRLLTL
jgi:hypothetical protein